MTLAASFNALGIVGYNGVSFGPSVDSQVSADPVFDSAGRTIIYYVAHFHFAWWVDLDNPAAPDPTVRSTTTDTSLEAIRSALMHNAGDFQYAGSGFGYLSVNSAPKSPAVIGSGPPTLDPVWGSKPRRVTFETYAGKAARCSFDVDVALLNCPAVLAQGNVMEFCFKITWDVTDGYTRRTYAAHLSIPATRGPGGGRTLPDNADSIDAKYLENAVPDVPLGFRRVTNGRTLSEDKCRLDITVVDEHWPSRNYPPEGAVAVKMRHSVRTGTDFVHWTGTFTGTYEYARGVNPVEGFKAFMKVVQDRLDTTIKEGGAGAGGSIVVTALSLTEPDAYDRARGEFSLDYFYVLDSKVIGQKAVAASGLWRLIPGSDYSGWARSMKDMKVWSPRGYAQLAFKDSDDLIIDLCLQTSDPLELTETPVDPSQPQPSRPPFPFPVPKPDQSFIDYQLELIFQPIHGTTELKPLPTVPVFYQGKKANFNAVDGYRSPYSGSAPSVIQYRTNPRWMLTLRGRALRAGYNITPPAITSIAGLTPAPAPGGRDYFRTGVSANLGVPIVWARWSFSYLLPDNLQQPTGAPENPMRGAPAAAPTLEFVTK